MSTPPPKKPSQPQKLDLSQLSPDYHFELKPVESPEDRQFRIKRDEMELKHRQRVFWAVFALLCVIVVICVTILMRDDTSVREQTFATSALSAIVAGVVGYFGGLAGKAPSEK